MRSKSKIPTRITKAGWLLIGSAFLIGATAYNSANNVLFLALSFLLSLILLNGILSWWNFSKLTFSDLHTTEAEAKRPTTITFTINNNKRIVPSLGFLAHLNISNANFSEELEIPVSQTINPSGPMPINTTWEPPIRGKFIIELNALTSLFPFGFILKTYRLSIKKELIVWPQRVDYNRQPIHSISSQETGYLQKTIHSIGEGEVSGIRQYVAGDSMRTLHWKKTASMGKPISKTRSSEQIAVSHLRFDFSEQLFHTEDELNLYCAQIRSWSEDLLKGEPPTVIQLHNSCEHLLTTFQNWKKLLNELAVIEASNEPLAVDVPSSRRSSVITPQLMKTK